MTKRRETSATKQEEEEERNWVDLPRDVLLLIFKKLDVVQILDNAQWVCRCWWHVSKDPCFYRSVVIQDATKCFHYPQVRMLAKKVVDRSCGQLVRFHCYEFKDAEDVGYFLKYLVDQKHPLKSLGLGCKTTTPPTTTPTIDIGQFIKRLPLLEELILEIGLYTEKLLKPILSSGRGISLLFFGGKLYCRRNASGVPL